MRILVTGATGVYGRSVVERLHRKEHEVVAMARREPRALPTGVRFAQGDVASAGDVLRAMEGCEAVVHLAFVVSPLKDREQSRRISVGGTQNVVDAMRETGARRLVFSSSAMSYGSNPDNPPLFGEDDEQRPSPDFIYASDKVAAERVILESGVDAVLARPAVTVGRNIDNLLLDIFAGPAIVGIKGVDIRYQLVHQEDVGRFLALAVESGPSGPVNVAPPDFVELRRIAELLGKRYVGVTEEQALKGVTFAWEHDLVDITPGEAAGISYMPRLATDRLREEWGFECAWTTAEAVLDLRRAVTGRIVVAKRRFELPWRLRFPAQPPGETVDGLERVRYGGLATSAEVDTRGTPGRPTYTAATACNAALPALTLSTNAYLLRAAVTGVLDALGAESDLRDGLRGVSAGIFSHRLYVRDDLAGAAGEVSRVRRRLLAVRYGEEVVRLSAWTRETPLVTLLPAGATLAAVHGPVNPAPPGRHDGSRSQAERTALALAQAVAAGVRERATRLIAESVLTGIDDAAHLTWDELAAPPADVTAVIMRRRGEHERLAAVTVPRTVSITPAAAALDLRVAAPLSDGVPA